MNESLPFKNDSRRDYNMFAKEKGTSRNLANLNEDTLYLHSNQINSMFIINKTKKYQLITVSYSHLIFIICFIYVKVRALNSSFSIFQFITILKSSAHFSMTQRLQVR